MMRTRHLLQRLRRAFGRESFALNGLDKRLARHVHGRRGVFVEAGANDGVRQSNTLYFERYRGWTGLLIEPIPALAERCRKNRPDCIVESCALVPTAYSGRAIEIQYCDLMSTVRGAMKSEEAERHHLNSGKEHLRNGEQTYEVAVPARTLSSVLDSHGMTRIDLLSLDVEGYEAEVLQGIDFERHRPRFILVEVRFPDDVEAVLGSRYRKIATLSEYAHHQDVLYALR